MNARVGSLNPLQFARAMGAQAGATLQADFAYAKSMYISLFTTIVSYAVIFLIWGFVLKTRGSVGGYSPTEFISYLVLAAWLSASLSTRAELEMMDRIRMGLVATDLLKPVGFQPMLFSRSCGHTAFQVVVAMVIPLAGFAALGRGLFPASPACVLAALASAALAFVIQFSIGFIFFQSVFVVNTGYGVFMTRSMMHMVFSGLTAPITAFPDRLRMAAEFLPFQHVIYTPVAVWLGRIPPADVPGRLLVQALWAAGLLLAGRALFSASMRRHSVQGG